MATTKRDAVVGINVAGIAQIKNALATYKSNVIKHTTIGANKANVAKAIKGTSSEAAFKTAAAALDASVEDLLAFVATFDKALDNLKTQYETHDKGVTYNLNGSKN